ncbi:MAG: D-tyrosyl-tRNA(Tyr) deacylase [Bdellovibrionales bacterium]|nr:D-tyrosyl-tRNA(Tyr) deacylase [Bdellovibrionales bacterium]
MRVVLQRVTHSEVSVDGTTIGEIKQGLNLLVGFGKENPEPDLKKMAEKICHLRIFPDDEGRFHHSVLDINGSILAVPQFTLYGQTDRGRRPDFFSALEPEKASLLFDQFVEELKSYPLNSVQTGEFGAYMQVTIGNDGPVTLVLTDR